MTTPDYINTLIDSRSRLAAIPQIAADARKDGQKVVGYSCPCIPEELILAAGMLPLRVPFGGDRSRITENLDAFCTLEGCEAEERDKDRFNIPVLSLELPITNDDYETAPPAVAAFRKSLGTLRHQLEELGGKRIRNGDILRALKLCQAVRENLRSLFEFPQSDASPVEWRDLFDFLQAGCLNKREYFLEETAKLEAALKQKMSEGTRNDTRPRLMICGTALGADDGLILELINQAGGVIVADCLCNGAMRLRKRTASFGLVDNPMDSLVELYLYNVPGPCHGNMPRRVNYVLKTIRDFRVHGLIYYSGQNKYSPLSAQVKPIKDRIYKELLVPTFVLGVVPAGEQESVRDRLNSFLDIVGGRV